LLSDPAIFLNIFVHVVELFLSILRYCKHWESPDLVR